MSAWVDVADLAAVVIRPTRLAPAPETVFEDQVHGMWLGNGLEIVQLREVGDWTEVRTPKTKPEHQMGEEPGTVVLETDWGAVPVVLKEKPRRRR
jgi:hypothetical protein